MRDTKILVVVKDTEAGDAYVNALSEIGVACDVAHSFQQMSAMAVENAYNGLLIDILTLVRCSKEEKEIAYECINLFPVLRVKWEARHKKIKLSPLEQSFSPDSDTALRFFIETRCKSFHARSLRNHNRKAINLSLLYCSGDAFSEEQSQKSFTVNLSVDGTFLHTMNQLDKDARVWLRFLELSDQTPIEASVRWSQRWGVTRCIPGVGLRFEKMTETQAQEIRRILKISTPSHPERSVPCAPFS